MKGCGTFALERNKELLIVMSKPIDEANQREKFILHIFEGRKSKIETASGYDDLVLKLKKIFGGS